MLAKSGSVLDAYIENISAVSDALNESIKISTYGSDAQGDELVTENKIAQSITELAVLLKTHINIALPNSTIEGTTPTMLTNKINELLKIIADEKERTANDEFPPLYNKPDMRQEISAKILELSRLSLELKSDFLLKVMLN